MNNAVIFSDVDALVVCIPIDMKSLKLGRVADKGNCGRQRSRGDLSSVRGRRSGNPLFQVGAKNDLAFPDHMSREFSGPHGGTDRPKRGTSNGGGFLQRK